MKKKPPREKSPAAPESEQMKLALAAAQTVIDGFKQRVRLAKLRLKSLRKALKASKRAARQLRKHAAAPSDAPKRVVRKKQAQAAASAPPKRAVSKQQARPAA